MARRPQRFEDENVQRAIGGKPLRRVIFVPDKILNLVV